MSAPRSSDSPGKRHSRRAPAEARDVHHGMHGVRHSGAEARGPRDDFHADRVIARLAGTQQNLISITQLRSLGLERGEWEWRVRTGHLHPVHRGVFAVGTPSLMPLARERAAVLAVGHGAVLSHGSAAAVWGMLPFQASAPVDIAVEGSRRSRAGIRVHRTRDLPAADVRRHRGFPLTSPARVVLDMACRLSATALERLAAEAIAIDPTARHELAGRGTKRIKAIVGDGPRRTRSQNERALLRLIRQAGLPMPLTNTHIAGWEVDAWWEAERLVVEVDDYATHGDRVAFERDRRRDRELAARGIAVLRVTPSDLERGAVALAATLAQALVRASA